jgi:hypothetical protein
MNVALYSLPIVYKKIRRIAILDIAKALGILFCCSWYILPAAMYIIAPSVVVIISLILICMCLVKNGKINIYKIRIFSKMLAIMLSVSLIYYISTYIGDISHATGIITQQYLCYLPAILLLLLNDESYNLKQAAFTGMTIMCLIVFFQTSKALVEMPNIARALAHEEEGFELYHLKNIGGFSFSYGMCFLAIAVFSLVIRKKIKLIPMLFFLAILFIVLSTAYFTAITILSIAVCILLLIGNRTKLLFIFFFAIIVLACFVLNIGNIISIVKTESVRSKLYEVSNYLTSSTRGTSINDRLNVFTVSITTFFKSPILGAENINTYYDLIGNHSSVFDTLAKSGIIGGFIYIIAFKNISRIISRFNKHNSKYPEYFKRVLFVILLAYVFLAFFNPVFTNFGIGFYVFLYIPLLLSYF